MSEKNILIAKEIHDRLNTVSFRDALEILGNVFLMLGLTGMKHSEDVSPINVANIVIEDQKKNGETIYNSLAKQGLLLLSWLNKK